MTATPAAPASAANAASAVVSAVVCAPQWARTGSGPSRKSVSARRRSSSRRLMPSPVVPSARMPSTPPAARKARYGSNAASSSALPPSRSGVSAAAIVLGTRPDREAQLAVLADGGGRRDRNGRRAAAVRGHAQGVSDGLADRSGPLPRRPARPVRSAPRRSPTAPLRASRGRRCLRRDAPSGRASAAPTRCSRAG